MVERAHLENASKLKIVVNLYPNVPNFKALKDYINNMIGTTDFLTISLNTDIAPVIRTSYNVNQHQLINSQNETIIRHDKQISDLYDYIEIYLDEIYRMELFKMQLELSL